MFEAEHSRNLFLNEISYFWFVQDYFILEFERPASNPTSFHLTVPFPHIKKEFDKK